MKVAYPWFAHQALTPHPSTSTRPGHPQLGHRGCPLCSVGTSVQPARDMPDADRSRQQIGATTRPQTILRTGTRRLGAEAFFRARPSPLAGYLPLACRTAQGEQARVEKEGRHHTRCRVHGRAHPALSVCKTQDRTWSPRRRARCCYLCTYSFTGVEDFNCPAMSDANRRDVCGFPAPATLFGADPDSGFKGSALARASVQDPQPCARRHYIMLPSLWIEDRQAPSRRYLHLQRA